MMAVWKFARAVAAGCTVVLKRSDTTPATSLLLAEIAAEFLPPGVLNVICGDRDTGRAVVSHKTPQMVAITGSVRAGMQVAEAAAADLKKVHLELGGKAPVMVFDDADLEAAAEAIAVAGYFNAGQDCTAATRVLAGPRVHDDFLAALTGQARSTRTTYAGGPGDEDALVPPVNNAAQMERVSGFLSRLPDHAEVTAGGGREGNRGYYLEPTVVAGVRQDDEVVQHEVFGPSSRCSASPTRTRRCAGRTAWTTGSPPACGRGTTGAPCAWRSGSTSAASGSTRTSHWSPRCRTAASSTPATARTSRSTASRTTPGSSTSCPRSPTDRNDGTLRRQRSPGTQYAHRGE